jgi:peroxiredoxin
MTIEQKAENNRKKWDKLIAYSTVILLVTTLVSVYLLNSRYEILRKEYQSIYQNYNILSSEYEKLLDSRTYILSRTGSTLKDAQILNSKGELQNLSELLSSRKLIYRLYSDACSACLTLDFDLLAKISKVMDIGDILIIADNDNLRTLQAKAKKHGLMIPMFSYDKQLIFESSGMDEKSLISESAFYIIDNNLSIIYVYPQVISQEENQIFIDKIQMYFQ